MGSLLDGSLYFSKASGESHDEKLRFFLGDQDAENVMVTQEKFAWACERAKLLPWVDVCSDVLGTNSLCPYFLSARQDSSEFDTSGFTSWVNPPFKYFGPIVRR